MRRCVYWKLSVDLKWVCESRILRVERRGPLNTSLSRKTARSDDISQVNWIVGWNELAKLTKMETFPIGMFHKENMSSINVFQTKGFSWLAASSRFSRSDVKITEKVTAILVPTAMLWVCTKCLSLNLKEFSSSMSRISFRKSYTQGVNMRGCLTPFLFQGIQLLALEASSLRRESTSGTGE